MTGGGMTPPADSGYAPVNGLQMYYEIHGTGEPLLLLHGGVAGIHMFGPVLPALAARRAVVAAELQGHGRTADIERPLRFETMADDVAALAGHLGLGPLDVMGYSLGAGVALQTAIRHPDVVRRLVVVSEPCRRDGWYPEVLESMVAMGPATGEAMRRSPLARLFPDVDWVRLFTKLGDLLRTDYDWSAGVAALTAPTLLVFADADAVRLEHVVELFHLLGGGLEDAGLDGSRRPAARLAVLPGLTHYDIAASPALAQVVAAFLDGVTPAR